MSTNLKIPSKETTASTAIMQHCSSPLELPRDLLVDVSKYFNPQDIQSCRLVDKNWNKAILEESAIWTNLFTRIYPRMDPKEVKDLQTYQTAALRVRTNIEKGICTSGVMDSNEGLAKESRKMFIAPGSFIARGNFYDEKGLCYLKLGNARLQLKSFDLNQKNTMIVINSCAGSVAFDESKDLLFASYLGSMGILNVKEGAFRDLSPPSEMEKIGVCSHVIFYENRLITGHFSGKILIWDSDSGAYIALIKQGWYCEVQIQRMVVLNDQLHVFYLRNESTFKAIYELETYTCIQTIHDPASCFSSEESLSNQIKIHNLVFSISLIGSQIIVQNPKKEDTLFHLIGEGEMHSLAFCDYRLFAANSSGNILYWDFACKTSDVFDEIATEFESGNSNKNTLSWRRHQVLVYPLKRFLRMSQSEIIEIYGEFYKLIKDRLINDYEGCAERIFNDLDNDQTCTDSERAQAIRNRQEAKKKNENSQ